MLIVAISIILTVILWKLSGQHRARNLALLGSLVFTLLISNACAVNTAAQAVNQIAVIVAGIIPIVGAAAAVVIPQDAAAITAGVNLVVAGLNELEALVNDYHKNPSDGKLATIQAAMTDLQTNLKGIESAAKISDAATLAKVNAIVQAATLSLASLESSLAATHPATMAAAQASIS